MIGGDGGTISAVAEGYAQNLAGLAADGSAATGATTQAMTGFLGSTAPDAAVVGAGATEAAGGLTGLAAVAPYLAPALGAFAAGYGIGTVARHAWMRLTGDATSAPTSTSTGVPGTVTNVRWFHVNAGDRRGWGTNGSYQFTQPGWLAAYSGTSANGLNYTGGSEVDRFQQTTAYGKAGSFYQGCLCASGRAVQNLALGTTGADSPYGPQEVFFQFIPDTSTSVVRDPAADPGASASGNLVTQPATPTLTQAANQLQTALRDPATGQKLGSYIDHRTGAATDPASDPAPPPTVVVPAPGATETHGAYLARLQALGLVGRVVVMTDATLDPNTGPGALLGVDPAPGTRVQLGTTVTVRANPDTAPAPQTGAGAAPAGPISPPALPGIDLGPIRRAIPCRSFPWGVPCWVASALGAYVAAAHAPHFTVHWPLGIEGTVDLAPFDSYAAMWRTVLLVTTPIYLAWVFFSYAFGGGPGAGSSGGEAE